MSSADACPDTVAATARFPTMCGAAGHIAYHSGTLMIEGISAESIAAEAGTPTYVYSASLIRDRITQLDRAFADLRPLIRFAVKANNNTHLLRLISGCSTAAGPVGLDVVSGGELERAHAAGVPMERVAFAGVGKTTAELRAAIDGRHSPRLADQALSEADAAGIRERGPVGMLNVESEAELATVADLLDSETLAPGCQPVRVALRVNPNIDARSGEKTTTARAGDKFGIDAARIVPAAMSVRDHPRIRVCGLHVHLGSPVLDPALFACAAQRLLISIDALCEHGIRIDTLDLGGGFGVECTGQPHPHFTAYADALRPLLIERVTDGLTLMFEPGRSIIADAGVLLTRVVRTKLAATNRIVVLDAGMNTLVRPALYGSVHGAWPVTPIDNAVPMMLGSASTAAAHDPTDLVGPICETGDRFLAGWRMPSVAQGDIVAFFAAGAYGSSMSSTYNDHPRPAEVLADRGVASLIRPRETISDLLKPHASAPTAILHGCAPIAATGKSDD